MTLFDDAKNPGGLAFGDSMILRHFDARLKPHLEFAVRCLDMDVHSILFEREEVEAVRSVSEDGGAHAAIVASRTKLYPGWTFAG
jgi:hypothetical protein